MKKIITIACILIATTCFGQGTSAKPDTTVKANTPLLTIEDINKLNLVIMKQFDLTQADKYDLILKEIQALILAATERRKKK